MEKTHVICSFLVIFMLILDASLANPLKPSKTNKVIRRKCGVKDIKTIHPERTRVIPKDYKFVPNIVRHLKKNSRLKGDKDALKVLTTPSFNCQEQYVIPVAFHILMGSFGEGIVKDEQILKQMDVLNDAYKKTPFQFKLSNVERVTNDEWVSKCVSKSAEYQDQLAVDPSHVLNIYTCPFLDTNMVGNAAMPWWYSEDSSFNAVVIHPETLPGGQMTPINLGDNAVHEIGHYFGLFHVFEDISDNIDVYISNKGWLCRRGRRSSRYSPMGYPLYTCPSDVKTCPSSTVEPLDNYMGYTDDICMNKFTPLQIERMITMVDMYRPELLHTISRPCIIDASFRWSNGYLYFFSGENYYRYNESHFGIDPEYPIKIQDFWKGVPSNIDGVFRYVNGLTYFFKGNSYLRFNDSTKQVDPGYPKKISEFWKGVPNGIDAVIRYSNDYTYFFKGDSYYRFNHTTTSVDPGYPKKMSEYWTGVPSNVEAAFTWYNGGVYFFKDAQFWLYIPGGKITVGPRYPRPVHQWWEESVDLAGYSVFSHCNGYTYFFKGAKYWRYDDFNQHVDYTYPKSMTLWNGVPLDVDDVFTWSNGYAYFFKGDVYYRMNFTSGEVDGGYPKKISSFWAGVPDNIDSVFRYTNGITYFFKGFEYYRFNDTTLHVDPGYPKYISSFWKGVPNNIDTAFVWSNGNTYFFSGNEYYRFNCTATKGGQWVPTTHWELAWCDV